MAAAAVPDVSRPPDTVRVFTDAAAIDLTSDLTPSPDSAAAFEKDGVRVAVLRTADGLRVRLVAPRAAVKSVSLHWPGTFDPATRCLGDAWERAYGDLGGSRSSPAGRCRGTSSPTAGDAPTATA